jgi:modulator of FtsH protease
MNDHLRTTSIPRTGAVEMDESARKVLRNTWNLLAMTLLFASFTAYVAMRINMPTPNIFIFLGGVIGLSMLTAALRNSAWGLLSVFAFTGFLGAMVGTIINAYLTFFSNGHELVIAAAVSTGVAFFGASGFAIVTKKDFSFLGPFLFVGLLVAFVAMLVAYFFQMTALSLAVAAMFALLSTGLMLWQTQQIVRGGERNYIIATMTLFMTIYNLFVSLLHLFGFAFGDD